MKASDARRLTCWCDAYPFPHRVGGGECDRGIFTAKIPYLWYKRAEYTRAWEDFRRRHQH